MPSASLLEDIFSDCGVEEEIARDACLLVRLYEVSGNPDANLLQDADSFSYFDVNLPLYYQREGYEKSLRRRVWGLRTITPGSQQYLTGLHQGTELQKPVRHALRIVEQEFKRDTEPARYQNA